MIVHRLLQACPIASRAKLENKIVWRIANSTCTGFPQVDVDGVDCQAGVYCNISTTKDLLIRNHYPRSGNGTDAFNQAYNQGLSFTYVLSMSFTHDFEQARPSSMQPFANSGRFSHSILPEYDFRLISLKVKSADLSLMQRFCSCYLIRHRESGSWSPYYFGQSWHKCSRDYTVEFGCANSTYRDTNGNLMGVTPFVPTNCTTN